MDLTDVNFMQKTNVVKTTKTHMVLEKVLIQLPAVLKVHGLQHRQNGVTATLKTFLNTIGNYIKALGVLISGSLKMVLVKALFQMHMTQVRSTLLLC